VDLIKRVKMTMLFAISCFLTAFTPSIVIFHQFVAKDPLRVILSVLGAFFWLVSLLLSALLWKLVLDYLMPAIFISALCQVYFMLIFLGDLYLQLYSFRRLLVVFTISSYTKLKSKIFMNYY